MGEQIYGVYTTKSKTYYKACSNQGGVMLFKDKQTDQSRRLQKQIHIYGHLIDDKSYHRDAVGER